MTVPPAAGLSPSVQRLLSGSRWRVRGRDILLDRPIVMGILNVTPDSFSDGGRYLDPGAAIGRAETMLAEGADIVDVGGESTRPQGARAVPASDELARVVPVVREIARSMPALALSVDTMKAAVAEAVLGEGAHIINDVSGFRFDRRLAQICSAAGCGVVLMHSRGDVSTMATYEHASYGDVVAEVRAELARSLQVASGGGVATDRIVVDPGLGFAKRSTHSVELLARLPELAGLGRPLLVGASRKRFVGELSKVNDPAGRVAGSVGAHVAALLAGASIFRVHDVAAARQALDVAWAIMTVRPRATGETEDERT